MNKKLIAVIFSLLLPTFLFAQDDIMGMLDSLSKPKTEYASASFKATRIVTAQSVEQMKEGQLDTRITHRFGTVNGGRQQFWGLDQASDYLSCEYGVKDWLMLGLGRTNIDKTVDGFVKIKLLRQSTGENSHRVTLSYFGSVCINTAPWADPTRTNYNSSRYSYVNQLLIARKFSEELSIQLTPTHIHKNLVPTALDDNDQYAMGIGGRYKLSKRMSVNAEYFYVLQPIWNQAYNNVNAFSLGLDIETGGHVFQFVLTNSNGMIEKQYITENTNKWQNGDLHLGFNISRVFALKAVKVAPTEEWK